METEWDASFVGPVPLEERRGSVWPEEEEEEEEEDREEEEEWEELVELPADFIENSEGSRLTSMIRVLLKTFTLSYLCWINPFDLKPGISFFKPTSGGLNCGSMRTQGGSQAYL